MTGSTHLALEAVGLSGPEFGDGLPAGGRASGNNALLERITDPVAREVYERKCELGIKRDQFIAVLLDEGLDDLDDW